MTSNMQKIVKWVCEHPDDYLWEQADERKEEHAVFHTTDIRLPMPEWAKVTANCHCTKDPSLKNGGWSAYI